MIGTCTIDGVVDDRWKVKGVKALRVINTSVFVEDVSGNITSSTYYAAAEGGRQTPNAKLQLAVLLDVLPRCLIIDPPSVIFEFQRRYGIFALFDSYPTSFNVGNPPSYHLIFHSINEMAPLFWTLGCVYGASSVVFGAFGAHVLKKKIADPQRLANWSMAAQYQVSKAIPQDDSSISDF